MSGKIVTGYFDGNRAKRDNASEPPQEPPLEARVAKLEALAEKTESRLIGIEKELAVIKTQMDGFAKHYATKADVTDAKNSIIMWVVSAILLAQLLPALLKALLP